MPKFSLEPFTPLGPLVVPEALAGFEPAKEVIVPFLYQRHHDDGGAFTRFDVIEGIVRCQVEGAPLDFDCREDRLVLLPASGILL